MLGDIKEPQSGNGGGMTRRDFMKAGGVFAGAVVGGVLLSACGVKTPSGTDTTGTSTPEKKKYLKGIQSYSFSVDSNSLGAVDPRDSSVVYPRAIKEGGTLRVGGANIGVTYEGGVFAGDDVTFMSYPTEGEKLKVGDILPNMYIFTQGNEKNVVTLDNLAMPLQGRKTREVTLKEGSTYCVVPMVIAGTSSDIVDYGNTVPKSFGIDANNMLGNNRGSLSWAMLEISKEKNGDGTWGAQMMGVVENTSSRGIYITDGYPDMSKYDVGD